MPARSSAKRTTHSAPAPASDSALTALVGDSPAWLEAVAVAKMAAPTPLPILITGETGTGKTHLAEAIHRASHRPGEFVAINCAALAPSLLESQLFGFRKGAFTGAERDTPGLFETAHTGTLLLDEIGDLTPDAQARLLRVIEQGCVRRIGSERETAVDVRILAATHQPLDTFLADGRFREDLFFRINAFVVHLPPLRERPGDIAALARRFLADEKAAAGREFSADAIAALNAHPWPGNIRELHAKIRQAIVRAGDSPRIDLAHVPGLSATTSPTPAPQASAKTSPDRLHTPVEAMRAVLADGGKRADSWARFLLALVAESSSTTLGRKPIVDCLRELRPSATGITALEREWKQVLRPAVIATGLVTDSGRRLHIETTRARAVLQEPPASPNSLPPALPPALPLRRSNVPAPTVELFGRESDAARIAAMLSKGHSLVTLTGPGGIGKTQLAIRVAHDLRDTFAGGAWFVDGRSARDAAEIAHLLALAMGLESHESAAAPLAAVNAALAACDAPTLIVFDNAEHLLDALPATIGDWRGLSGAVRFLLTSRRATGLPGEVRAEVGPLAVPELEPLPALEDLARVDAVKLFLTRASTVRGGAGLPLTADSAGAIAAICAGAGGNPLALELAAARAKILSPQQIADRLVEPFKLLRATHATEPAHRSLHAVLAFSFDLLAPAEQAALAQSAVFAGGFTLAAAEAVFDLPADADALDALHALAECHLMGLTDSPPAPRVDWFPLVHEFAEEKFSAEPSSVRERIAARHAAFFAAFAAVAIAELLPPETASAEMAARVETEFANLRAAFEWAMVANEAPIFAPIALALAAVCIEQGDIRRAIAILDAVLHAHPTPDEQRPASGDFLWAQTVLTRARAAKMLDEPDAATRERLAHAREICEARIRGIAGGDEFAVKNWRRLLADLRFLDAASDADLAAIEAEYKALGHEMAVAYCLLTRGARASDAGDQAVAKRLLERAESICRRRPASRLLLRVVGRRGLCVWREGDAAGAVPILAEAVALARQCRDRVAVLMWNHRRSVLETTLGHARTAVALTRETETIARAIGHTEMIAASLWSRGRAFRQLSQFVEALPVLAEAARIAESRGNDSAWADAEVYAGLVRLDMGDRDAGIAAITRAEPKLTDEVVRFIARVALAKAFTASANSAAAAHLAWAHEQAPALENWQRYPASDVATALRDLAVLADALA